MKWGIFFQNAWKDIFGQSRALATDSKLTQLDDEIDDLLGFEADFIDARGLHDTE